MHTVQRSVAHAVSISLLLGVAGSAASSQSLSRVSVNSSGAAANDDAGSTRISPDGRLVAFVSGATNLAPGDSNGTWDAFIHDRVTGETIRLPLGMDGAQPNGASGVTEFSADLRYVVLWSDASNLVPGDTNGERDCFVYDRGTGQITRVSVATDGTEANRRCEAPQMSPNGRFIVFNSEATNLVAGADANGFASDIFLHDRSNGRTTRLSVNSAGIQANDQSAQPALSGDGRFVAFWSWANNLVPGDTNIAPDIFLRDIEFESTIRVSVSSSGGQGDELSRYPSISTNGRWIAFASRATNLVDATEMGDRDHTQEDIYLHDRATGETTRISEHPDGTPFDGDSYQPALSSDGQTVMYRTRGWNIVAGDDFNYDIVLHDVATGEASQIVAETIGFQPNGPSFVGSISSDGAHLTFTTASTNLLPGDLPGTTDAYAIGDNPTPDGFAQIAPAFVQRQPQHVTMTWTEAADADSYRLQIALDEAFTNVVFDEDGIEGTSFTLPPQALAACQAFYWRITAHGPGGDIDAAPGVLVFHTFQVTDATLDGAVGFADLNLTLERFGDVGVGLPEDFNGDGVVNFADINILLSDYNTFCD